MKIFSDFLLHPPKNNEFEITFFGPGYGESIVLHIPGEGWGIIDSCVKKIEGKDVTLPLEYLLKLIKPPLPPLSFVVLTHPHEDHYRGLADVLRNYPGKISRVCRYGADGIREFKSYISEQKVAGNNVLPGFPDVLKSMVDAKKRGASLRRLSEFTDVFNHADIDIEGYGKTSISLTALTPSAESVEKYRDLLFKAVSRIGQPVHPLKDDAHNIISVALLLKVGKLQIVLGSDVEVGVVKGTGWLGLISNKDCPDLLANFVKVAHHGSKNGYSDIIWEKHLNENDGYALISPFLWGDKVLPDPDVINYIKSLSKYHVGITSTLQIKSDFKKQYTRDVIRSVSILVKSVKIIEKSDKVGFLRIRSSLDGKITECHAEPPAKWL